MAEFVLQTYGDGIPELDVKPLDPVSIKNVTIENPGFVNINMSLIGGKMHGLSKAKVLSSK